MTARDNTGRSSATSDHPGQEATIGGLPDLRSHFPPWKDSRRTSFRLLHPNKTPNVAQNNNKNRLDWLKPYATPLGPCLGDARPSGLPGAARPDAATGHREGEPTCHVRRRTGVNVAARPSRRWSGALTGMAAAAVVLAGAVTGCAAPADRGGAGRVSSAEPSRPAPALGPGGRLAALSPLPAPATARRSPSPALSRAAGSRPPRPTPLPAGGGVVLSGLVVEGLRASCRVLDTGVGRWSLVGAGVLGLGEGDRVRVVGRPRPELVGLCGPSFEVRRTPVVGRAARLPSPACSCPLIIAVVSLGPVLGRSVGDRRARPCALPGAGSGTPRRRWRRRRSRTGHLLVVGGLRVIRSGSQATEAAVRPAGVAQPGRARSWICPGQTRADRGARRTADRLVRRWRTTPPTRAQGASKARRPGRSGSCSASRSGRERRRRRTWAGSHQACS